MVIEKRKRYIRSEYSWDRSFRQAPLFRRRRDKSKCKSSSPQSTRRTSAEFAEKFKMSHYRVLMKILTKSSITSFELGQKLFRDRAVQINRVRQLTLLNVFAVGVGDVNRTGAKE
jgi:hypothetical protein